jgi:hypothetical protein
VTNQGLVRPKVLNRYGLVSNDQRITTNTINEFIQASLNRIASMDDWWWLRGQQSFVTVAGQTSYVLAADMQKLKMLSYQNIPIHMIQPERAVEFALMRGLPRYFYLSGDNIVTLTPTPSEVYSISYLYYSLEVTIANDGTTFKLPDRFEDMVVVYTCIYIARRLNDSARENEFKEELALLVAEARRSNMRAQGSLTPVRRTDWMNYG